MKPIRGTYDLYYKEMKIHNELVRELEEIVTTYGYSQIKIPIFENTELFRRSTGESSDIVQKEMYDFTDKGGRELTLRPELTAGTVRAFITNKIYGERLPQYKFFYYGEVFRYERPQSLRYRQFYQFGIEFFGETSKYSDIEVLALGNQIISKLNLNDKTILKINTIGTSEEREKYNQKLRKYFEKDKSELCEDCLKRLELNPLKILDCKIDSKKEIVKNAPLLLQTLSEESILKFEKIKEELEKLNIKYEVDNRLVRGLDYYNDIVFEFEYKYNDETKTIIAGGRYDTLVEQLNGPQTPAIGFGIGVERLIEAIKENKDENLIETEETTDIFYLATNEKDHFKMLKSMTTLRNSGISCYGDFSNRSSKSQYKLSQKMKALYVIIFDQELDENTVRVKNMITKEEINVKLEDFEKDILSSEEQETSE